MLEIIKKRTRETITEYYIEFSYKDDPTAGFSFPADSNGELLLDKLTEAAKINYENCLTDDRLTEAEFKARVYTYSDPAIGKCVCGSEVVLNGSYLGADRCECGRWYNLSGQELRDPKYWEEDYDY